MFMTVTVTDFLISCHLSQTPGQPKGEIVTCPQSLSSQTLTSAEVSTGLICVWGDGEVSICQHSIRQTPLLANHPIATLTRRVLTLHSQ